MLDFILRRERAISGSKKAGFFRPKVCRWFSKSCRLTDENSRLSWTGEGGFPMMVNGSDDMLTHEDRRQLTANGIAAKNVVWAEDLVPVAKYTSHGIVWLLVSLDDDGALSCVVDWGYGYFILDRLPVEDFFGWARADDHRACARWDLQWPEAAFGL
jgi:hypothetical protein